jgi:hypothetical protein
VSSHINDRYAVAYGDADHWKVVNKGDGVIYYAGRPTVSSTDYDGTIASGAAAVFMERQWLICARGQQAEVEVYDVPTAVFAGPIAPPSNYAVWLKTSSTSGALLDIRTP